MASAEHKYAPPRCKYSVESMHIRTDGSVKNKLSGTHMGALLKCSPWSTPFQVACDLLGLGREDISSKPSVKTGTVLEPRIIKYLSDSKPLDGHQFQSAEDAGYQRSENPHADPPDWEDKYFGGHLDGIVVNPDGTSSILEIKTTINKDSWLDSEKNPKIPDYYYWQVALYNHFLTKSPVAYFGLGVVSQATYKDHNSWVPNENTVCFYKVPMPTEEEMERIIQPLREWYDTYIANGITPDYDPSNERDVALFNHLVSIQESLETMSALVEECGEVRAKIKSFKAEYKALEDRQDELDKTLKSYMLNNALTSIKHSMYTAKVTESVSWKLDEEAMVRDGIDVSKYMKPVTTQRFNLVVESNTVKSKAKRK